ncbi:hypothetical protein [Brevundimonas sp.]|jgi:hypothetical protein|uniref:hypothetical protein n=1 Tax=Brevundimonas sp. TaxID=1871086 RepID=UPI002E0D38CD|nr:hypothetical protein [Brevundimonas sp.]
MARQVSRRVKIAFGAMALVLAFCAGCWFAEFDAVDGCLDAGGRWNEGRGFCEGALPRQ